MGLVGVVIEGVEFDMGVELDEEAEVLVVSVRPKKGAAKPRCGRCAKRCGGYDNGEGRRRWWVLEASCPSQAPTSGHRPGLTSNKYPKTFGWNALT